ncbi:MAG: hypothetical protein IJD86_13675, partial [Clostridia bacterium]|nr:hypothetical protein [Clostridia bacterium]
LLQISVSAVCSDNKIIMRNCQPAPREITGANDETGFLHNGSSFIVISIYYIIFPYFCHLTDENLGGIISTAKNAGELV